MTTEINQSHCYDLFLSLPDKTNKANKIQSKFLTQPTLPSHIRIGLGLQEKQNPMHDLPFDSVPKNKESEMIVEF